MLKYNYIKVKDVASHLHVSTSHIYSLINKQVLPTTCVGKTKLIRVDLLEKYLSAHTF